MTTIRYSDQQGSKSRQKVMPLYKQWHRPISKRDSTIGEGGDTMISSPGRSPEQPLPGIGLRDPLQRRQACPELIAFDQGVGQSVPDRGCFHAVFSQNGDKIVTSPPSPNRWTGPKRLIKPPYFIYREQPRSTPIVVAYPRPAFSATNRTFYVPISFDQL